jgi:hypothetical protein
MVALKACLDLCGGAAVVDTLKRPIHVIGDPL